MNKTRDFILDSAPGLFGLGFTALVGWWALQHKDAVREAFFAAVSWLGL